MDGTNFQSQIQQALASYAKQVGPGRLWAAFSALTFASNLGLLPTVNATICRAIVRGHERTAAPPPRQLWFHPADLPHIINAYDNTFRVAVLLSFDLLLRAGQLEHIKVADIDHSTQSVWCPPHKSTRFPYLRKPKRHIWDALVKLTRQQQQHERVFPLAGHVYSKMLGDATEQRLGIRLTWHSLRRGGATHRAHLGEPAEQIRRFACWTSERAITHYIFPWSAVPLRCRPTFENAHTAAPPEQ